MTPLLQIGPERADEYLGLLKHAYSQNLELGVRFGASDASRDEILVHLRENLAFGFADDATGDLIATVSLRMPWGPNPGYFGLPHIGWLATAPSRGRQGLAGQILETLIERIVDERLHAPAVSLGTAQEHPWLGSYYSRHGFDRVGSADLGLGHITDFYIRPLDNAAFDGWRARHADLLEGLTS